MLRLEEIARQAVKRADAKSMARLARCLARIDADRARYARHIALARQLYPDGQIELDAQPLVSASPGNTGVFVSAWVWTDLGHS